MDSGFVLTAGGTALVSTLLIQFMKNSELSIFNFLGKTKEYKNANFAFSLLVAFVTSIGISVKYDGTAGTLLLSGLTAANLAHGCWHWFVQWISQHAWYKNLIVPSEQNAQVITLLKTLVQQVDGDKK